jgi:hypothetical protein
VKKIPSVWPVVVFACFVFGGAYFVAYKQHDAAEKYRAHRAKYCTSLAGTPNEEKACEEERTNPSDNLNWRYALVTWPQGIETWGIIVTGFFIGWQAWETRRSAHATATPVLEIRRQREMSRDQQRARLEIDAHGLKLEGTADSWWNLKASLRVRNIGPSKAYFNQFQTEINWCESDADEPVPDFSTPTIQWPQSYINPTEGDVPESSTVYFWKAQDRKLDWFANGIYSGENRIFLHIFVAFNTAGTDYKRIVSFEWKGSGRPGSVSRALYGRGTEPSTAHEKLEAGYWYRKFDEEREIDAHKSNNPN